MSLQDMVNDAFGESISFTKQEVQTLLKTLDAARDCIQPITVAQIKLHNLNPNTDKILDEAAKLLQIKLYGRSEL